MNNTHTPSFCRISRAALFILRICVFAFFVALLIIGLSGCQGTQWNIQREITPGVSVGVSGSGKEVREITVR